MIRKLRDISVTGVCLVLIAAGFYAFQFVVLGIVGLVIYWSLPFIKRINSRSKRWK